MSHGRSCAGPRTREVGKHLGEVAVSYGEGDTDPRNYRVVLRQGREPARLPVRPHRAGLPGPARPGRAGRHLPGRDPGTAGTGTTRSRTWSRWADPGGARRRLADQRGGRRAPDRRADLAVGLPREFWTSVLSLTTGWVQRRQHMPFSHRSNDHAWSSPQAWLPGMPGNLLEWGRSAVPGLIELPWLPTRARRPAATCCCAPGCRSPPRSGR
jgi:hypothetical protein